MACFFEERNCSSDKTSHKRQRTATLLDLDVIDCPACFHTLTIPIFQCYNGHIACSTCCEKLRQICATCTFPILFRNRAMERVLEQLRVPCPNSKFGCSENLSYDEKSTHLKQCAFAQHPCPFSGCYFIGLYKDLYEHGSAKHLKHLYMFECGKPVFIYPKSDKRVVLKEHTTEEKEELVVVEFFNMPQGRIIYASCIGTGTCDFLYSLKLYSSSCDRLYFESSLERVREVSGEPPNEHFMLVPSYMSPDYKLHISIDWESSW